jgi:putative phosphoesterase
MNFLIGSDIHGSIKYGKIFFSKVSTYNPRKIILLGDNYYNGARNDPPEDYAPKEVVKLLNSFASSLIAIKGNCESEVDQMVSDFPIVEMATMYVFNKEIVMTHGHHFSFDNLPKDPGDVFLQGHTHIGVLEKKGNLILANPGSVSLPKDNRHSYLVLNDTGMTLRDLFSDEVIKEVSF